MQIFLNYCNKSRAYKLYKTILLNCLNEKTECNEK